MAKIKFCGAAGTVTGSRHLLELNGQKLLIDCGLFQGKKSNRLKNWEPFLVPPANIDKVFLTHAHIDHTGYLPRITREGFSGPIYCTHATKELCEILLMDSAHIQEEDARWANKKGYSKHKPALPLFTTEDAEKTISQLVPVHFGDDLFIADDVRVKWRAAGHILGASIIDVKIMDGDESKKILFSGDLGRANELVLPSPSQAFEVDYLVLESTYGDRLHEDFDPHGQLERVVNESVERGGVLLIPAFSVGRTQTVLYILRQLEEDGRIPKLPVYVDSPMAIEATEIFKHRIPDLNLSTRIDKIEGKDIFQTSNICFCKSRQESMEINDEKGPAIIISASGMVTAGRIVHHMSRRLRDPKNTVLFVGYQAAGTRGRTILDGRESVKIHGNQVPIHAHIESISGFSGHADYNEILAWLLGFNRAPKQTFLVHGEPEASAALAEKIHEQFGWNVTVPEFGQSFELAL